MKKVCVSIEAAKAQSYSVSGGTISDIEVNRVIRICNKFKANISDISVFVNSQQVDCTIMAHGKNKQDFTADAVYRELMLGFTEANHADDTIEPYVQYLGRKKLKKFEYELRFTHLKDNVMRITITRL